MPADAPRQSSDERLTKVESLLSHLQHDVDKLNAVLISQQEQIDELQRLLEKVEAMAEHSDMPRDPFDERPPHY